MYALADTRRVTLLQHGIERLRRLCPVLGFDQHDEDRIIATFSRMSSNWGRWVSEKRPRWPSDICDDHSPFEFSVAIDGDVPELRILAEIQAGLPTMLANWNEALVFNEELESEQGVVLDRFRAIQDLFAPTFATPRFCMWHAVCFRPGAPPDYKLYLNPAARGPKSSRAVIEQAMSRLGFADAGSYLLPPAAADRIIYFSLDLPHASGQHAPARVKVYTAHQGATAAHIEEALRSARGHVPGQVSAFCEAMAGGSGPYCARPAQTCLSFTAGSAAPTSGTVYFPVRSYADTDLEVRERILARIHAAGAPIYERALAAHATRPLEDGVGMQTYVSLRQAPGPQHFTIYLSPQLYAVDRGHRGHISGVITRPRRKSEAV